MIRRQRGEALAVMLDLAAGPDGLTNAALRRELHINDTDAAPRINGAQRRGHIFRADRPCVVYHWFDTAERAREWELAAPPPKPKPPKPPKPVVKVIKAKPSQPAPVRIPIDGSWRSRDIDYSRAVITVAKPPVGRFDVPEDSFGAGFSRVGLGRDINTGRGWGS